MYGSGVASAGWAELVPPLWPWPNALAADGAGDFPQQTAVPCLQYAAFAAHTGYTGKSWTT